MTRKRRGAGARGRGDRARSRRAARKVVAGREEPGRETQVTPRGSESIYQAEFGIKQEGIGCAGMSRRQAREANWRDEKCG
jgi:hypothetical protein